MGTRQKIKEEEEWIRSLINENEAQESAAIRAWKRMMDYYLTKDFLDGHHHVEIIIYIYQTKHYLNETFYCFAWKNFIGERTLYRYRKKYILCFKRYYTEEKQKEKFVNLLLENNLN